MTDDLIDVTLAVTAALDRCDIPYTVGGSLASSLSGEPRASLDADVVVQIRPDQIDGLVNLLGDDFYADRDAIRRAVDAGSCTNLVHRPTGIKVDLFPATSFLDHQQLLRRQLVKVATDPDRRGSRNTARRGLGDAGKHNAAADGARQGEAPRLSASGRNDTAAGLGPGADQPHNNLQPYLTFYFCVALQGVFPPRGHARQLNCGSKDWGLGIDWGLLIGEWGFIGEGRLN